MTVIYFHGASGDSARRAVRAGQVHAEGRSVVSEHAVPCECITRAKSREGRPLAFFNEDMSGGFIARYADTNEIYESHECFIDDILYDAGEARFGGIVIQPA